MVTTDLLAFKQAKEKEKKEALKRIPRKLEARLHSAWWKDHDCCKCFAPISGGMSYIREVYSIFSPNSPKKKKILVKKYHWPICPDNDFREYERLREEEEARRTSQKVA